MAERIPKLIDEANFSDQENYFDDYWIVRVGINQMGHVLLIPTEIAEKEKQAGEMWDIVASRILARNFPEKSGRIVWNRLTKKVKA